MKNSQQPSTNNEQLLALAETLKLSPHNFIMNIYRSTIR
jgi:hypothetical protein